MESTFSGSSYISDRKLLNLYFNWQKLCLFQSLGRCSDLQAGTGGDQSPVASGTAGPPPPVLDGAAASGCLWGTLGARDVKK